MMRPFRVRPRLSLRVMIGLVAVAALLIWGGKQYWAWRYYRASAAKQDMYYKYRQKSRLDNEAEALHMQKGVDDVSTKLDIRDPGILAALRHMKKLVKDIQNQARFDAEMVDYHFRLRQKYEYASCHPWVEVAPDPKSPPEPEPEPEPK
jgi:hypothetical protein